MRWRVRSRRAGLLALASPALPANAETLRFAPRLFADTPHTANIVDADGDGRLEIPGLFNRGTYMAALAASRMGLSPMFRDADGRTRHVRDLRMVDLDNDGDLDLAANSYWCAGEPRDRAQVYWRHPDGRFELSPGLDGLPPLTGWGETILAADFDDDGYLDLYLPGYTRHDLGAEIPECHGIAAPASGQSWLLRNRGAAAPAYFELRAKTPLTLTFADCGADCGNYWDEGVHYARPEGAQAFDYDEDGRVDVFVSGMLFRNRGALDFERVYPARGTHPAFDEGAAIIDWNHDGYPDLVTVTPWDGVVHLFAWQGGARDASGRIVTGGWSGGHRPGDHRRVRRPTPTRRPTASPSSTSTTTATRTSCSAVPRRAGACACSCPTAGHRMVFAPSFPRVSSRCRRGAAASRRGISIATGARISCSPSCCRGPRRSSTARPTCP